jgi:hypothetical protein
MAETSPRRHDLGALDGRPFRPGDRDVPQAQSDGGPYTPAWGPGDDIVMFYPESGRCFGLLDIVSEPDWQPSAEQFFLTTCVRAWNNDTGPTLADIGVLKALQGGR